jgi:N-acetylneuraminic acid mutarotase
MNAPPVLTPGAQVVAVEPGGEASLELKLRSNGSVVDSFTLEVLGPAARWTTVDPPTVSLFPGDEGRFQVRFRPPRSWTISAGILTVGFRAASSVEPGLAAVEECELHIAPFTAVTASMRPRTSRARMSARHQILVESASNTAVDVALSAQEVDGDPGLRVRPARLRLRPGRTARATLRVKPAYTIWFSQTQERYSFEASAVPQGGEVINMPGSMRQSAVLPRGLMTLILLAVAVLVAIVLYPQIAPRLVIGPVAQVSPAAPIVATPGQPQVLPSGPAQPSTGPSAGQPVVVTPPPASGPPVGPGGPGWAAVGAMGAPREQHTATALPDGRVLVAGGMQVAGSASTTLASAELYDPGKRTWSPAASMASPRSAATATALSDGRVLVVGGQNQSGAALTTAELYDPASNRWSAAGQLHAARILHSAVLLTTGKVLVAGGRTGGGSTAAPLASTELYDPSTNTWSAGPNLSVARSDLTATLLDDGRVLLAGGDASAAGTGSPQAVVDLINAQGQADTRGVSMGAAREDQTATLMEDGRVLVVGGTSGAPRAEVFAPATGTWSAVAAPSAARRYQSAVLLPSGQVLVAGGADTAALATAEAYNPTTNTWAPTPGMVSARWDFTLTGLQTGQVLASGGLPAFARTATAVPSAELFG